MKTSILLAATLLGAWKTDKACAQAVALHPAAQGRAASAPTLTVTAFAPASGAVGQQVTVRGTGFSQVTAVAFGQTPAPAYRLISSTRLVVSVPPGISAGRLTVTTRTGAATSTSTFQVRAAFADQVLRQARTQQPAIAPWLDTFQAAMDTTADLRPVVAAWVAGGLDEQQLAAFMQSATDQKQVFRRLRNADKGLYQQRVIIDDYEHIPGVKKEKYVANGLLPLPIAAKDFGVDSAGFDLPGERAPTFSERPRLVEIKPGEKLYRVTNDSVAGGYDKTGSFWTRTAPAALAEVIGGVAVKPEWNSYQRVYEFTAPAYADSVRAWPKFYVWEGPAARQAVSSLPEKVENGYCLPGGGLQLYLPDRLTRKPGFSTHIRNVTARYKSW